jgi:hypothetical protein
VDKKYKIGDWVHVCKRVHFLYNNTKREMALEDCDMVGQIVGATRKRLGSLNWMSDSEIGYEGQGYCYFDPDKSIFVWKVSPGMLNKHVLALPDHVEPYNHEETLWKLDKPLLPWLYSKLKNQ